MGIDSTVHSLLVPPPNLGHTPHTTVAEEDAKLVKAVEEHFGKEGYQLPVKEDATEMAGLTEREMMFLVRQLSYSLDWRRQADAQSRETIMRYVHHTSPPYGILTWLLQLYNR
jgi:hypothetical protein